MPEERESDHEQAEGEQAGGSPWCTRRNTHPCSFASNCAVIVQKSERTLTQNVLAACGFDMKFQYVMPGWEGSATDAQILQHALSRPHGLIVPPEPKKIRRHTVFNSTMDDEMLGFLMEQTDMGRQGDRGFKVEAYTSVANSMNAAHDEKYLFTADTIKNRCKKLKADYASVTKMLNASGFDYDNSTHRIVVDDEVWIGWLRGHPKANTWRSRTIDYDKLSMVFGRDSATGRFARSSVDVTTPNIDAAGQGNTHMSGSFDIRDEDMMQEVWMSSNGGGGSYSGSKNRKRKAVMTEFMAGLEKSSAVIRDTIDGVAEKMGDPIESFSTLVYRELKKIPDLSDYDVEIAHE